MRASPAFRVSIRHDGAWRAGVCALLAVTLGAQAAWLAAWHGEWPAVAWLPLAALDLALLAAAARVRRVAPVELHWDSRCWHWRPADEPGARPAAGSLTVALDLGPWMLLRLDDLEPSTAARRTWLPVQRRGLEAHWHALRCAVYCARPAPGIDAGFPSGTGPQ